LSTNQVHQLQQINQLRSSSNNSYQRSNAGSATGGALPPQQVLILSSPEGAGINNGGKGNQRNIGMPAQTPKNQMMMRSDNQGAQNEAQQSAMQEKYAAMLNKNLEDTSNLAKTLRNTKVNIYDKLRNSYQNANQLI
jgi:hypothetical protein